MAIQDIAKTIANILLPGSTTAFNPENKQKVRKLVLTGANTPAPKVVTDYMSLAGRNLEPLVGGRPTETSQYISKKISNPITRPLINHFQDYAGQVAVAGKAINGQYNKPEYQMQPWEKKVASGFNQGTGFNRVSKGLLKGGETTAKVVGDVYNLAKKPVNTALGGVIGAGAGLLGGEGDAKTRAKQGFEQGVEGSWVLAFLNPIEDKILKSVPGLNKYTSKNIESLTNTGFNLIKNANKTGVSAKPVIGAIMKRTLGRAILETPLEGVAFGSLDWANGKSESWIDAVTRNTISGLGANIAFNAGIPLLKIGGIEAKINLGELSDGIKSSLRDLTKNSDFLSKLKDQRGFINPTAKVAQAPVSDIPKKVDLRTNMLENKVPPELRYKGLPEDAIQTGPTKAELEYKPLDAEYENRFKNLNKVAGDSLYGVTAGIEPYYDKTDKQWKVRFNPQKAAMGMVAIGGVKVLKNGESPQIKNLIDSEVARLKDMIGGVSQVKDADGTVVSRQSSNPQWYRDFFKENKRSPNESEWRSIAEDNIFGSKIDTFWKDPEAEKFVKELLSTIDYQKKNVYTEGNLVKKEYLPDGGLKQETLTPKQYKLKADSAANKAINDWQSEIRRKTLTPEEWNYKLKSGKVSLDNPPVMKNGEQLPKLNLPQWKDRTAFGTARETMLRNIEDVSGSDSQKVKDFLYKPNTENNARMNSWLDSQKGEINKKVHEWGIRKRSPESSLVQKYGEGLISLEELKTQSPKKWSQIAEAATYFRKQYDAILDMINEQRTKYGYEPIPKRQDYFRHFQDIGSTIDSFGVFLKQNDLPTEIAGQTDIFKPWKPFTSAELRRTGDETTYDAVGGFENYLDSVARQIFHLDTVQRGRMLENYITEAAIRGEADLPNFKANLIEWTNIVSGKKTKLDRGVEQYLGRSAYSVLDWLRKRTSLNMVAYNISSAITNTIPFTQTLATMDKKAALGGLFDATTSPLKEGSDFYKIDGSDSTFLRERFRTTEKIDPSRLERAADKGFALFQVIDKFMSRATVMGKYLEQVNRGADKQKALSIANEYAEKTLGQRAVGKKPVLFDTKTLSVFTQFQLEVNNQMSYLLKDIPKMSEGSKLKLTGILTQYFLYSYLYNNLFEKVSGRRPTLDVINAGLTMLGLNDEGEGKNVGQRIASATEQIGQNVPFGNMVLGGGRFPVSSGIPNPLSVARGDSSLGTELMKPITYLASPIGGGGQFKKTIEGLTAFDRGSSQTPSGRVRFQVPQTGSRLAQTALFGQYSTPEARDYFNKKAPTPTAYQPPVVRITGTNKPKVDSKPVIIKLPSSIKKGKKVSVGTKIKYKTKKIPKSKKKRYVFKYPDIKKG